MSPFLGLLILLVIFVTSPIVTPAAPLLPPLSPPPSFSSSSSSNVIASALETCPTNYNMITFVPPGCPCNPLGAPKAGLCTKGYVCAELWSGEVLRQRTPALSPASSSLAPPPPPPSATYSTSPFVCQPCAYGQYCPEGSVIPPSSSPLVQLGLARLACPSGRYCPTPSESYPCIPGSFCAQGSVQPVTCNISVLVDSYPILTMPTRPTTVYESVYIRGQTLAGNQCPANASTPSNACPGGYYCPSPGEIVICPAGYYCKAGSQSPSKCPALTSCPEGSAKATLSWVGFIMLAGVLGVLWISYLFMITILRLNQRNLGRTQAARERLWKLLNPLFASQTHSKSQAFRAFKAIRPKITIQFDNLGLTLHDGHAILSGVSGRFSHSRVTAIMGPSGAGKSTFLNVVMGKTAGMGRVSGGIRVNGREMKPEALRGIVGFVPQEDVVHEDLTVRENLVFQARLRLSAAKPLKEQLAIVDDVINVLQLRHVQHQVVGSAQRRGISGGQRKRVNIGMELVAKPSVLFMDEPTSGLDSTAAADILGALKRMAGLGMNIITVIHQPRFSIFSLFDDVMLLCKGGKLAYLGPSRLALPYLEFLGFILPPNENPADFAMDVLSGSVPRSGATAFQPEELVPLWESQGRRWVKMHEISPTSNLNSITDATTATINAEAVDPEQLRLLEESFDRADGNADGAIDAAGLIVLLQSLGLEPARADISMIMAELAQPSTGLIQKDFFMLYVRYGGRPPTENAPNPGLDAPQRRVDSLYRVYSIEQYTLGNALAEIAAGTLPIGLKSEPPPSSLKSMAVAAMEASQAQQTRSTSTVKRMATTTATTTATAGAARAAGAATKIDGTTTPSSKTDEEVEGIVSDTLSVRSSTGSVSSDISLPLPPPPPSTTTTITTDPSSPIPFSHSPVSASPSSPSPLRSASNAASMMGQHALATTNTAAKEGDLRRSSASFANNGNGDIPFVSHAGSMVIGGNGEKRTLWWRVLRVFGLEAGSGQLRTTPGVFGQLYVLFLRCGVKWARNWATKFADLLLLIVAAVACGAMHGTGSTASDVRGQSCLVLLTLGILTAATSLSVFGKDRLVFWRETASGVGVLPYFLANTALNMVDVALHPLVFLAIYTSMTLPAINLAIYYFIGVLVVWWTSSAACLVSVLINNPSNALVASVAIIMISGGFINGVTPNYRDMGATTKKLTSVSYNRWAVEGVVIATYGNYPEYMWPLSKALVNLAGYCGLDKAGIPAIAGNSKDAIIPSPSPELEEQDIRVYCAGYLEHALLVLFLEGLVLRLGTLLALWTCPRGMTLEPLVSSLELAWERIRTAAFKRKAAKRRTVTGGSGGSGVGVGGLGGGGGGNNV